MDDAARNYLGSLTRLKLAASREQDRVQLGQPPSGEFAQEMVLAIDDRQSYAESLGQNAPSARPT